MTVYAKQVPLDIQESPLWFDLFYDEYPLPVIIINGDWLKSSKQPFESEYKYMWKKVPDFFEEITDNLEDGYGLEKSCKMAMQEIDWTYEKLEGVQKLIDEFGTDTYFDTDAQIEFFRIVTGLDWKETCIHGCVQGDWADVLYLDEVGFDIRQFQSMYFNTGTEWIVHYNNSIPECAEDIDGYSVYICDHEDVEERIREEAGKPDDDVVLYEFTEYAKIACYSIM